MCKFHKRDSTQFPNIWDTLFVVFLVLVAGSAFLVQSCDKDAGVPAVSTWCKPGPTWGRVATSTEVPR